jgi:uncharacterized membrane protein YfcA
MDFVLIPLVSAVVAALTLVSGFGLGTVLLPAFAFFFPIELAVAAAGVVHFANNLFKLGLVGRWADCDVVVRFGVPAVIAALAGASLMTMLAGVAPIYSYRIGHLTAEVTWLRLVIAALLASLAALELSPAYQQISFPRSALPLGGVLSGFVGGVSGMQGALRAPFLLRAGLSREAFVGTTNVISTLVDVTRLLVYALGFARLARERDYAALEEWRTLWLVGAACAAGFLGSFLGTRLLKKITLQGVRRLVAALLFASAGALAAGIA